MSVGVSKQLRLPTALAILAICVPAVVKGTDVVRFAIAEARLDQGQDSLEALKGWRDSTGVAGNARDPARLTVTNGDRTVLARQHDALEDYLTLKPLSPVKWLALAFADLSLDKPIAQATGAYQMSLVTGPYEGYVMPRRAIAGALLWEKLGSDERIGAARDLALATFTTSDLVVLRGILGAKLEDTRSSIRFEMLQIEGLQADRLQDLALQ
jgi:hypothetical protein